MRQETTAKFWLFIFCFVGNFFLALLFFSFAKKKEKKKITNKTKNYRRSLFFFVGNCKIGRREG